MGHGDKETSRAPLKPKRRWGRKSLLFLLLLIVAYYGWGYWETRRFEQAVASLRAVGEPTQATDFSTPAMGFDGTASDAAVGWPFAGPARKFDDQAIRLYRRAEGMLDQDDPVWRVVEQLQNDFLPLEINERAALSRLVSDRSRALALIERASSMPAVDWEIGYYDTSLAQGLPHLGTVSNLMRFLRLVALHDFAEGRHADAVRRIEQMLKLARPAKPEPFPRSSLSYSSYEAMVAALTAAFAPEMHVGEKSESDARPNQVRTTIDRLLDDEPARRQVRVACQGQRVMMIQSARQLADGRIDEVIHSTPPSRQDSPRWLTSYLARPWVMRDARELLHDSDDTMRQAMNALDWPACRNELAVRASDREASILHLFRGVLKCDNERWARTEYECLTERRLAAIALAVRWYACEHGGKLPSSLQLLVPRYLPRVPADPMADGSPELRYLPLGDRPIIYSVGRDGVNDGGSMVIPAPRHSRPDHETSPWERRDVVVPLYRRPRTFPAYDPSAGN